jgi:hypothetical protein
VNKFAPITCEQDNRGAVHDNTARLSYLSYRHWLLSQASSLSPSYNHLKTLSASITTRDKLVAYQIVIGAVLPTSAVNFVVGAGWRSTSGSIEEHRNNPQNIGFLVPKTPCDVFSGDMA